MDGGRKGEGEKERKRERMRGSVGGWGERRKEDRKEGNSVLVKVFCKKRLL